MAAKFFKQPPTMMFTYSKADSQHRSVSSTNLSSHSQPDIETMSLKRPNITKSHNAIPSRVKQAVPLKVADSMIHDAGRGMFVLEAVPARSLIFSVARPLLCIVSLVVLSE
jgi:hypothetical protein